MCKISETFLSSILKGFDNTYYLVPINPVFDELSFGIKFITYSIWNHSATPLEKGYAQPCILKCKSFIYFIVHTTITVHVGYHLRSQEYKNRGNLKKFWMQSMQLNKSYEANKILSIKWGFLYKSWLWLAHLWFDDNEN